MIESFLRPPRTPGEFAADGVRVLGVVSLVVVAIGWGFVETAVIFLTLGGLVLARMLDLRPGLDIAVGLTVLVAAWSSVLELYLTVPVWDLPVHFFANGLLAAVLYILLRRTRAIPDSSGTRHPRLSVTILTSSLGVVLGVLWEFAEWAGHTYIDESIFVSYEDTLSDLAVGALGSIVAGWFMHVLSPPDVTAPR